MNLYECTYLSEPPPHRRTFQCEAANAGEAMEKCCREHPGCSVIGVKLAIKRDGLYFGSTL